ncbi:MAG: intradiol ring-cleavage dioxygenase [Rhizobiales bacterium]|nr:intradiol ring-cleavage dioxygenase [Hyphomicrobiales bacterium]MBI3672799.1 intradiol ring-cleavage dioxygenase [Hyphomicrobiales bacterium]
MDRDFFTERDSEAVVISRSGPKAEPRVKEIVDSLVRHLHAVVKEPEPTLDEWLAAISFLTRTGKLCTDWRQEFILLSDVLGISMLVETINNRKTSGETESTVLGPFHVAGAPHYDNGANICRDGKGTPLFVSGRVLDTEDKPIAGASLDVWQANDDGFYDVQQKGTQPDNNLRGIFTSDRDGRFHFRSAYPHYYPIPADGTAGDLLRALDRDQYRPAHIHFIVSAPGFRPVTTHLFTPDCPWLKKDAVFGVKQSLIADFRKSNDAVLAKALGVTAPFYEVAWDFILGRA